MAFDRVEARILGALIEKEATTPEAYPLTANAVVLACNQKNNREPVMELEPGEVGHALRELEQKGLIRSVHGARAQRYEHRFAHKVSVTIKQQAVLSVMMLRGPQTVPELLNRCERLSAFVDTEEVRLTLERLMQRTPSLVVKLGRASGQREDRYMHLLCGAVDESAFPAPARSTAAVERTGMEARVEALESAMQELRDELEALRQRIP
ncbi:MAG: YceH family protein [Arenimonas sp.]|nr:YceH family protein [Arenimonas sp.]